MDDQEFLQAFEQQAIRPFPHRDHIRVAWLYLRANGWESGYRKLATGILTLAAAVHAPNKYHETITRFWAQMVYLAMQDAPEITDFTAFAERYPHLFDSRLIEQYYSQTLLRHPAARLQWIEPDLAPLHP